MAISKKEFFRKESRKDQKIITEKANEIEVCLDRNLKKGLLFCKFKAKKLFEIYNNNYIRDAIINELEKRYKKAGWKSISITNINQHNVVTITLK